ncbi:recombinase family protein [Paenibacillus chitinolyticus]|uniref:recombinase family protein n=1 Tax=Paenibacillus chitinolyticus TaxID=79263 RepID=UPI00295EA72D|nr:recombinase family protein [Paenibacillus chitinolyticus]
MNSDETFLKNVNFRSISEVCVLFLLFNMKKWSRIKIWAYRLYEEVTSGERVEARKEIQKLLWQLEDQLYDRVLVMDIDRLNRGENKELAIIKVTFFLKSETVIITLNKIRIGIYNDDVSFDFMSILPGWNTRRLSAV